MIVVGRRRRWSHGTAFLGLTALCVLAACAGREPPLVCPEQPPAVADCANGFCAVPAGCFTQGDAAADPCGGTQSWRRVVLLTHALSVQQHEVRRGSYRMLTGEDPWASEPPGLDERPAEVSWYAAAGYCNALSRSQNLPRKGGARSVVFAIRPSAAGVPANQTGIAGFRCVRSL